ncbi:hypothetical protein B0J13DRAFT_551183 [Dactylonectria estremocensis]|uniref:Uncharacterized protein n=1 Tax=Dactylonectria estremocensis TaxID=1079267 RepID=A0A9P9F0I4_9HYPO|nr:hypothetical protein B0J13DRAFT_551183 [Dactylonectria estremocensis]
MHTADIPEQDVSKDPGLWLGRSTRQLNPRAREFLSFNGHHEDVKNPNVAGLTRNMIGGLLETKVENPDTKLSINTAVADSALPFIPFSLISNQPQRHKPATQSNTDFGGIPVPKASASTFGPLFGFAPPTGPPLPPTPASGFPLPLSPPYPSFVLNKGIPVTRRGPMDLANDLALQSLLNINNQLPFGTNIQPPLNTQQPSSGGAARGISSHQGPVPKPRIPDTKDQQAYEAYIEWRKATEPGYAIECKTRQQRRARRNVTTSITAQAV